MLKTEHIIIGGIGLAAFIGSYYFLFKSDHSVSKKNGINYDVGPSIRDPDPFLMSKLEEQMPTRTVVDDYVQTYNRWINGYRDNPTMIPENYYKLPFRYDGPDKGILTSEGVPDSFGSNPINPNPNAASNWIRQPFFF